MKSLNRSRLIILLVFDPGGDNYSGLAGSSCKCGSDESKSQPRIA